MPDPDARPAGRTWDVSPLLTPDIAVFPGDTSLRRTVLLRREDGEPITLSTLRATVHLGAHVDAPLHYGTDAPSIDAVPLERLLGACRLVRPDPRAARLGRITAGGLADALGSAGGEVGTRSGLPPRVLIATESYPDPSRWTDEFVALDPAAVDYVAALGVRTVGIDTPSVDPASSKDLPAHAAFLRHDMTILEGLVLKDVPEGDYELIALPLRLAGFDASPVRAILRDLPES